MFGTIFNGSDDRCGPINLMATPNIICKNSSYQQSTFKLQENSVDFQKVHQISIYVQHDEHVQQVIDEQFLVQCWKGMAQGLVSYQDGFSNFVDKTLSRSMTAASTASKASSDSEAKPKPNISSNSDQSNLKISIVKCGSQVIFKWRKLIFDEDRGFNIKFDFGIVRGTFEQYCRIHFMNKFGTGFKV